MNKLKQLMTLVALFLSTLLLTNCETKDDSLNNLKGKEMSFEHFFEKVSSMNLNSSNENVFYIDYEWNRKNNTINYISSIEKEPDFFLLESGKSVAKRMVDKGYQVSCSNGDSSWDKECSGKWSCGKLIAKCLDKGGCAEICKLKMAYAPQSRTFYLLEE